MRDYRQQVIVSNDVEYGQSARSGAWINWLIVISLLLLMALPRLTALNRYLIVDEADRWRWAEDFVYALSRGDLAGTLVGDGYPGIIPLWAESVWIFIEAIRRSLAEGQWIGEPGLNLLFHEWDRTAFLFQQRLPIVVLNTFVALAVVWAVWRLFGEKVALLSGLLIALDPFYLSDSRVNRAEAVITGFMTLSMLSLVFYHREHRFRYVVVSGFFGGLSFLTKIQALAILPAIALTSLLIYGDGSNGLRRWSLTSDRIWRIIRFGLVWAAVAFLTWIIFWPSMWVTPLETLTIVYNYTTRKVGAEGVNLFFLGQTFQDTDPGPLFYPIVFLMRSTPLTILGLAGAALAGLYHWPFFRTQRSNGQTRLLSDDPFALKGSGILVVYILLYALVMSAGSHKQDRYLMPVFLSIDILAAMGLIFIWHWTKSKTKWSSPTYLGWGLCAILIIAQLMTVLPHHPYYYSYFNPLFGGGRIAIQTLRIGWGEGMDQVGAYLAAKPNSHDLVVSSRFTHNMLGFPGELLSLGPGGRWTKADYIVLYIQQVQRKLDPSPGFIDYFQARTPEKVVNLGGIDYAWIYPIPFTTPANPQVSVMPGKAAVLGYSWEDENKSFDAPAENISLSSTPRIRLLWENLGMTDDQRFLARLIGAKDETEWIACRHDPAFIPQSQTPGAYVESLCEPEMTNIPSGTYTVEFGLTSSDQLLNGEMVRGSVEKFVFPEGWHATLVTANDEVMDTPELERLEAIVDTTVPTTVKRLDTIYDGRLRLVAYQIEPAQPKPGQILELTLYWQPLEEIKEFVTSSSNTPGSQTDYQQSNRPTKNSVRLTVQLADSRGISLGRVDVEPKLEKWLPGEVVPTRHRFQLATELAGPLAAQIEVNLINEIETPVKVTNSAGEMLEAVIARLTIAPDTWPDLENRAQASALQQVKAAWQSAIILQGYGVSPSEARAGESLQISLFWKAGQPIAENYVGFVHLVDETGQIKSQNDGLPRAGAYPTPWWQPNAVVEDVRTLALPEELPAGNYQLVVGLYRFRDGVRLPLIDHNDSVVIGTIQVR